MDQYHQAARKLLDSGYVVALTGAGISVESGIPDFRSSEGLWSRYDPVEFGHIESFRANPGKVWKMLLEMDRLLHGARPSPAHHVLAELEKRGILRAVITQNVDSLHQRAGSRCVIEYHGHGRTLSCAGCERRFARDVVSFDELPPRCPCGGPLRPDFVFFGELIPPEAHQQAMEAVSSCDMLLIVGTSATVAPASQLPRVARRREAFILEINPSSSAISHELTDLHIVEAAGRALPAILAALESTGRP